MVATGYATGALYANGVRIMHVTGISRTGCTFHGADNDDDGGTGYNPASAGTHFRLALGK